MNKYIQSFLSICTVALFIPLQALPNWSTPVNVAYAASYPQICCDAQGNQIAVWLAQNGTVYGSKFINNNWSTPESNFFWSRLFFSADMLRCLRTNCHMANTRRKDLWHKIYARPIFPPADLITDSGNYPQICCDSTGQAIVVWQGYNLYGIYGTKYTPGSSPAYFDLILDGKVYATTPQICCDSTGNAIVAWIQNRLVYGAGYTPGQDVTKRDPISKMPSGGDLNKIENMLRRSGTFNCCMDTSKSKHINICSVWCRICT